MVKRNLTLLVKDYLSSIVLASVAFADLAYHKSKSIALINFACVSGGKDSFFFVKLKNGKVVK